ncbi:BrnT family toxin [Novosphingobium sp.]|uniref:BrnT family toxin n=1 Tax=Novosphingobium sp. TaxID=1874826 RepID=UPI003340C28A
MDIEFDPAKDSDNIAKHGVSLADFAGFDAMPVTIADDRQDYGEARFRAFGRIDGVPHMIAYTVRSGKVRLISFRRAHAKEMRRHE